MAPCLCCESCLLTWTKRSSYPCWHGGAEEEQAALPVVSSGSIKPFFATRLAKIVCVYLIFCIFCFITPVQKVQLWLGQFPMAG